MRPALFVSFEGVDGSGKSTQVRMLEETLRVMGRNPLVTREPGGTPLGAQIRNLLLHGDHVAPRAEALLFAADRAHHADTKIRPALIAGRDVITDRYVDSSVAYQGSHGLVESEIRFLSHWGTAGLVPDVTFLLDCDPAAVAARRSRGKDRIESLPDEFHYRVRDSFLRSARAFPLRFVVINGEQDPNAVHEQIVATFQERVAA